MYVTVSERRALEMKLETNKNTQMSSCGCFFFNSPLSLAFRLSLCKFCWTKNVAFMPSEPFKDNYSFYKRVSAYVNGKSNFLWRGKL